MNQPTLHRHGRCLSRASMLRASSSHTQRSEAELLHRLFRVVPAPTFLAWFASDRSHMVRPIALGPTTPAADLRVFWLADDPWCAARSRARAVRGDYAGCSYRSGRESMALSAAGISPPGGCIRSRGGCDDEPHGRLREHAAAAGRPHIHGTSCSRQQAARHERVRARHSSRQQVRLRGRHGPGELCGLVCRHMLDLR
jgi:hypothetical protein